MNIRFNHSEFSKYNFGSGNRTYKDLLNRNSDKNSIVFSGFYFTISTKPSVINGTTLSLRYYLIIVGKCTSMARIWIPTILFHNLHYVLIWFYIPPLKSTTFHLPFYFFVLSTLTSTHFIFVFVISFTLISLTQNHLPNDDNFYIFHSKYFN